jgi:tellurite resistance protein TehA-like permease
VCTDATETPSSGVQLDPVIWAIIGFAVGVTLTVIVCLLLFACCYFTCFSARQEKRKKYDVQGKSRYFQDIIATRLDCVYYISS